MAAGYFTKGDVPDASELSRPKGRVAVNADPAADAAVAYLRTPEAIRERAGAVLARGLDDGLQHFRIDLARLAPAADLVAAVTRARYPDLRRARCTAAGGTSTSAACDRAAELERALARRSPRRAGPGADRPRGRRACCSTPARGRRGATRGGDRRGRTRRSEGLAVASFRLFARGRLLRRPRRARGAPTPRRSRALTDERLARGPPGLGRQSAARAGTAAPPLLRRLGGALRSRRPICSARTSRVPATCSTPCARVRLAAAWRRPTCSPRS